MTKLEELKAAYGAALAAYNASTARDDARAAVYDALDAVVVVDDECADDPDEVWVTWIGAWEDCCDELNKKHKENSND